MSERTHSPVEQFYAAVALKFGVTKKWSELHPIQQMNFVQAVNVILQVVRDA